MTEIVIAPFSNSDIRDWPIPHFAALVGLLLPRLPADGIIRVIGTANQRLRAREIVRDHAADRVRNECGKMQWAEVVQLIGRADCVVANNSSIGHLGGYLKVPTVSVFGGSQQRREWRPLGGSVIVVSRAIGCSPCMLDHKQYSPYAKACLRQIAPEAVADAVHLAMARGASARELEDVC